ncbi:hypothetical protein [uncultured Tateyamaria sp.]|uniref:hypothetical protein n=1 Tax=uncultured Tateyamaria sp. TaxID=455651 RepID=UPI00262E0056|nr:hypothetical protein [uncultured Tateyamaria sp.]
MNKLTWHEILNWHLSIRDRDHRAIAKTHILRPGCWRLIVYESIAWPSLDREAINIASKILSGPDTCRHTGKPLIVRPAFCWVIKGVAVVGCLNVGVAPGVVDDNVVTAIVEECRRPPSIKCQVIWSPGGQRTTGLNTRYDQSMRARLEDSVGRKGKPVV